MTHKATRALVRGYEIKSTGRNEKIIETVSNFFVNMTNKHLDT